MIVIVVEDTDEDFHTVQEAVLKTGLTVDVRRAATGAACLDLLRGPPAVRPALVLMDLNTPGISGRDALEAIKTDPTLKTCPVVVLSTSANPKDVAFCYRVGANAYHVKPVRYAAHLGVVADLVTYWLARVTLPEPSETRS